MHVRLGTHPAMHLYVSQLGCDCVAGLRTENIFVVGCCVARQVSHWRHIDCYTEQGWGNRDFYGTQMDTYRGCIMSISLSLPRL